MYSNWAKSESNTRNLQRYHHEDLYLYYLMFLLTIFFFSVNHCDLYNYADDNTLPKSGDILSSVIKYLVFIKENATYPEKF